VNISIVNAYDVNGGAARAAYRIHRALLASGERSTMSVDAATSGDWTVDGPTGRIRKQIPKVRHVFGAMASKFLNTQNPVLHSVSFLPSQWPQRLNSSDANVVNLHWINHEMISIRDVSLVNKPLVWTLHDMWAICGAEHYTEDFRWREGYFRSNRPAYESGFDLNRWVWKRKQKFWRKPVSIITPSHWLADCVKQSVLMHDWPVTVIHNAIDTNVWQPVDKVQARHLLGLPQDVPLLLFGAMGGARDPRKGFGLLREALETLRGNLSGLHLVVFGQMAPREPENIGFDIHYMGHLHDDLTLQVLYSAADLLAIPSRQDNLPNTGVEALACGTPVVAFNACGLPDIVQHEKTGFLARAFDAEDFAAGIRWVLGDAVRHAGLRVNARADAVARFSYPVVAEQYVKAYKAAAET
jgi:glycosyltransferase involved in cell wall biosynthesis